METEAAEALAGRYFKQDLPSLLDIKGLSGELTDNRHLAKMLKECNEHTEAYNSASNTAQMLTGEDELVSRRLYCKAVAHNHMASAIWKEAKEYVRRHKRT